MSKQSRLNDKKFRSERCEATHEAAGARLALRETDREREGAENYGAIPHAGHALFVELTDTQHLKNTTLRHQLRNGTDPVTQEREGRRSRVLAFRKWKLGSEVRRRATPVVESIGDVYLRMSNGMRRLVSARPSKKLRVGHPFPA